MSQLMMEKAEYLLNPLPCVVLLTPNASHWLIIQVSKVTATANIARLEENTETLQEASCRLFLI